MKDIYAPPFTGGEWEIDGEHIKGERYICTLADWHIVAARYDD